MTTEPNDELSEAEREAYASLREETPPAAALEDQVVAALHSRHLLARAGGTRWGGPGRWAAALAAGTLLFVAGMAVERAGRPVPVDSGSPRFMLLLHEDENYDAAPAGHAPERVEEYRQWARGLAQAGHFVTGEKLEAGGSVLLPGRAGGGVSSSALPAGDSVAGFFIISADSYEAAVAAARGCPHLLHGGRIEIRPIDAV